MTAPPTLAELALKRIDVLMDAKPDTPEEQELSELAAALQAHEEEDK